MNTAWFKGISFLLKRLKTMASTQLTTSVLVVSATVGLAATTTIGTSLFSSTPTPKSKSVQTKVESNTQDRPAQDPIDLSEIAKEEVSPTSLPQIVEEIPPTSIPQKTAVTTTTEPERLPTFTTTSTSTSTTTTTSTSSTTSTTAPPAIPSIVSFVCIKTGFTSGYTDALCDYSIDTKGKNVKVDLRHQEGSAQNSNDAIVRTTDYGDVSDPMTSTVSFHFIGYNQVSVYIVLSYRDADGNWQEVGSSQSITVEEWND